MENLPPPILSVFMNENHSVVILGTLLPEYKIRKKKKTHQNKTIFVHLYTLNTLLGGFDLISSL
jgi:hypothetical protein